MKDPVESESPAESARILAALAAAVMPMPVGEGSRMRHTRGPAKKGMQSKRTKRNRVRNKIAKASRRRNHK